MRIARACVFACLLSSSAGLTTAHADWTPSGPYGGAAELVRVAPGAADFVLAASANGLLYQSRNGGASWSLLRFPPRFAGTLHALEIDPRAPGTWYAGVESETPNIAGVYKTDDAGAHWRSLEGLKGHSVWSLAIAPGDANRLAAGTSDGVFLSADAGATWRRISPEGDPELRPVVALAFDPADSNVLYAGTTHLPWRTRDGGAHWESIHEGMIDDSDVFSIAVQTNAPANVFASACSGVYRSGDGGASWKRMETPRGAFRTYLVALDPYRAGVVFAGTSAGLLRSADRGATWKTVTAQPVKSIAFDPVHHEKIFFASPTAGLLLSRDGGLTVAEFNTGFVNRNFTSVAAAGQNLYAATVYEPGSGGIFRTSNRGLRWVRMEGPKAGENILKLAVAPDDQNRLYAAGYDGLFRSADGGATWTKPVPLPGSGLIAAMAPLSGGRLLAAAPSGLFAFQHEASQQQPWRQITLPGGRRSIDQLQSSPGGALAALTATGALRSDDGGATWAACGQPVAATVWYALAFDGAGGVALAATSRGLFRSTDRCATWRPVLSGLEVATVTAVVFHPDHRGQAFIAQSGRIFRTDDAGLTWAPLLRNEPADVYPTSLFFLFGAPQRLFALFPRRGVFSIPIDATADVSPGATSHLTGGYLFDAGVKFHRNR